MRMGMESNGQVSTDPPSAVEFLTDRRCTEVLKVSASEGEHGYNMAPMSPLW